MLLDERLLESCGDAITPRFPTLILGVLLSLFAALPPSAFAQNGAEADRLLASFSKEWPDLYARLIGVERAQGVLFGALVQGRGKVKEPAIYQLTTRRLTDAASGARPDPDADKGYAALGARGAEVIQRAQAFHREVLAIFAAVPAPDRQRALDAAVDRYLSQPKVALPDVPKDMGILYDHPYTSFIPDDLNPRRKLAHPSLTGVLWASHWFQLAVEEPLEASDVAERRQGLKVVNERFERTLSAAKLPDGFPEELPLAPCIAPGLVAMHERAAAIIDNLSMMEDVLVDVLVHPKVKDVRAAVDEVITQFTDRTYRVAEVNDWITMALRHSIFAQGGPALRTMTQSERNSSGHVQHLRGRSSIPPGGMR